MVDTANEQFIRILLFAGLREQAGWNERLWPLPHDPASKTLPTPSSLWSALNLPGNLGELRIAINRHFATADTPLHPGDELAFLPPISGG